MSPPRLFVEQPLTARMHVRLEAPQAHYLRHVLRLRQGAPVLVFNGVDGEWLGHLADGREAMLVADSQVRPQREEAGPLLLVAPIKRPRLEWLVEKAVELGVARLAPVLTERSVVRPESSQRLRRQAIEAAEQCGRLTVPEVEEPGRLLSTVETAAAAAGVAFADEAGGGVPLLAALENGGIGGLLVGPEGGFAPAERAALLAIPGVVPVSLGPLVLRAETAAIYAMACSRAVADRRG